MKRINSAANFFKKNSDLAPRARALGRSQQHNPQQAQGRGIVAARGAGLLGGCSGGARVSGGLLWVRGDPRAGRYGVGGARGVRAGEGEAVSL